MQFRTQIPILKSNHPIDYHSKVVSLGSCFAVNMAEKLEHLKFQNIVNPFGILFHPLALEKFIGFAVNKKTFTEADIFFHNERWHCFDAHSDLSSNSKQELLDSLNDLGASADKAIRNATHIIITLGTAWVYKNNTSNEIVANCHKMTQKEFTKELLSVSTISESLDNMISMLEKAHPGMNMIFTISPVRHIKDGFVENQWSKSNLISALHEQLQNHKSASYFPSYEIMMDELRDYRFYAEDMIHPNQTAIDYIWERFSNGWISESSFPLLKEIDDVQKALAHKPFNPESDSHQLFVQRLQERILNLQKQLPHLSF